MTGPAFSDPGSVVAAALTVGIITALAVLTVYARARGML